MQLIQAVRPRAVALGLACFLLGVVVAALADCGDVGHTPDAPVVWRAT